MRSGPEHHDVEETKDIQDYMDDVVLGAFELAGFGEEGRELISKMDVFRSQGAETEKQRHVEEFMGDPDSLDYAIDIADTNPDLLVDQLVAMESGVREMTPEQITEIEKQLERATQIGGKNLLDDIGTNRDVWRKASFELDSHDFSDKLYADAWERIDKGKDFGYEDLAQLAGLNDIGKQNLYEAMDSGSQIRFAITYPSSDFLTPEDLQGAMNYYADELPTGMARLDGHAYTWNLMENPMKNPNLNGEQLDAVVSQLFEMKCQPKNINAYYNVDRVFRFVEDHANCGENTKNDIQRYRDWMKGQRSEERS